MKKSIKCGIAAAVLVAAGFTAYQSYSSYGVQDNSLLMQNVEALASGADAEGDSDDLSLFAPYTSWCAKLKSGKCGFKSEVYEVSYTINGASQKANVGFAPSGKAFTLLGIELNYPNIQVTKKVSGTQVFPTGSWRVCGYAFWKLCDRRLQILCDGTKSSTTDLDIPTDALL